MYNLVLTIHLAILIWEHGKCHVFLFNFAVMPQFLSVRYAWNFCLVQVINFKKCGKQDSLLGCHNVHTLDATLCSFTIHEELYFVYSGTCVVADLGPPKGSRFFFFLKFLLNQGPFCGATDCPPHGFQSQGCSPNRGVHCFKNVHTRHPFQTSLMQAAEGRQLFGSSEIPSHAAWSANKCAIHSAMLADVGPDSFTLWEILDFAMTCHLIITCYMPVCRHLQLELPHSWLFS